MSTPVGQWDPEKILEIGDVSSGITCVGRTHSENRRCHNPIAAVNREQATHLLHQMSRMDVLSDGVEHFLKRLASLLLCQRRHQNQLSSVAGKWRGQIEGFRQEAADRENVAEWEEVTRSGSVAVHEWITRLEESLLNGSVADIQKTVKLLGLAQQRERKFQAQLAELGTLNADLTREVDSLRTQLSDSANDAVHNRATSATSPTRAREPSRDSDATFRHHISVEGNYQSLDGHRRNVSHRILIQFELQSESVTTSQQSYPQNVSQPDPSILSSVGHFAPPVTVLIGIPGAQDRTCKRACSPLRSTQLRAGVDGPSSACDALDCIEGICGLKGRA